MIRAFGLLNPEYEEGHNWYGIPHPGMMIIDNDGRILEKSFEEYYRERQTVGSLFAGDTAPAAGAVEIAAEHFAMWTWVSDEVAFPGNRISLLAELQMLEGHHAYAPGEHEYRVLALHVDPHPFVVLHETRYPEAIPFHFAPLNETVPVFEGRFRISRDLTLATSSELREAIAADPVVRLTGRLDYQVCSATVCYPPSSRPLSWSVRVREVIRERVPEELRRR